MNLTNANVLVLGLGLSGEHSTRLAHSKGATLTVADDKPAAELGPVLERLADLSGITYCLGAGVDPTTFDLVVRSPGITNNHPALAAARQAGTPVWSELELAWRYCPCPAIAITGTNGKGTTTTLIAAILRTAGRTVHVAGNIGTPLAQILPTISSTDIAVLEVSHVHLEDSPTFAPATAVITNIRPEHGALYPFDYYKQLKARITANHGPTSATVVAYDDHLTQDLIAFAPGQLLYTSHDGRLPEGLNGVYHHDGHIMAVQDRQHTPLCSADDLTVPGALPNLVQAAAAAWLWNVQATHVKTAAHEYRGREHVCEFVGQRDGISYYNDAKATNPYSTVHALQALSGQPVVLIAGGKDDKGADFGTLRAHLGSVAHVIAFGDTAADVAAAVAESIPALRVTQVSDYAAALSIALQVASRGDALLLSPGTHSWDMTPGYVERGEIFKAITSTIVAGEVRPDGQV